MERDFPQDVLVRKSSSKNKDLAELKIATSSLRRRAFGQKNSRTLSFQISEETYRRLKKLEEGDFDATLFLWQVLKNGNGVGI